MLEINAHELVIDVTTTNLFSNKGDLRHKSILTTFGYMAEKAEAKKIDDYKAGTSASRSFLPLCVELPTGRPGPRFKAGLVNYFTAVGIPKLQAVDIAEGGHPPGRAQITPNAVIRVGRILNSVGFSPDNH